MGRDTHISGRIHAACAVCVREALGNNLRCLRRVNIDWLALFEPAKIYL